MSHTPSTLRRAFCIFYVVLGTTLLVQSVMVAIEAANVHFQALGAFEALAAILFLIPATLKVGAWTLLMTFMLGAGVHLREGEWPGVLLVYAAGTVFVWLHGSVFGVGRSPSLTA